MKRKLRKKEMCEDDLHLAKTFPSQSIQKTVNLYEKFFENITEQENAEKKFSINACEQFQVSA